MESCDDSHCAERAVTLVKVDRTKASGDITTTVLWDTPTQRPRGWAKAKAYCADHTRHVLVELVKVLA